MITILLIEIVGRSLDCCCLPSQLKMADHSQSYNWDLMSAESKIAIDGFKAAHSLSIGKAVIIALIVKDYICLAHLLQMFSAGLSD